MATPDTSILKGLSKDRQANLAAIAKQAQEDPEYGINSLKVMLDELKALSPAQRRLRFGFEQDDLFKIATIRQNVIKNTDKSQITEGFYFPGKQEKIARARQIRKSGYEKASKEEAEYQSGLNKRTPLEKLGVGLRAGFEGYIAPNMVRAYEERGLPMEDALGYIDFRDPLQAGAATAGFSYGQNVIPGATSIPGNLLGGAIGGGLGTAIGRRVLGGAAAGWLGGLGGLAGGMGGAMATSALGERFLNPITGVSDPGKAMLSEKFSGPERAIGNVLAPVGLFSVMQGPRGARTFFEGDQGMRGALTSLATNPAAAVRSKVVSPFVDAASRIVQVNQTQNDINAANEEARQRFREENGYEGSEEELVSYGYTRPSERLNQALMDASLGGFGRLGNVLSGESFFSGMRDRAMAKEAKKVMGEIEKGTGAAGTIPTQTTRTAPFGVIKTAVPRKSEGGAGRVPYPVSVLFDEGDKPNFRVKDTTATLLPTVQRSMTSEFKKPQPVPVMDGSGATMDVIGLAPSGEVFVLTQDLAKNNVVQTRLYSDLPKVLQERVDRIARRTVSEGATVPDFTAVSDTGYAATQDAYKGFQRTFPNTVTVDGVDVNARVLTVDDDAALVELPSGSTFYVPKDFVNAKSGKKIELGEQRVARDFAAARDSKGNPVFTELTIDGEKTRVFVDESNRAQAVNPSIFLDSKTGETANPDAVGTLVDMGELRFGETAKAREQGVVVGVDTFKVGDEDASGYWVQSLNDPSARPFLVAQTAVQVAAKTPNAGATKVDPAVVTKLKKKLEELIDGESGLKDLINKHKSRVLENLIKDIEAGENSINKSPVTEDDVVRGFENIRNEVSKKDAISQFNELQEDFKKRVLEPYAEEVAGDSVITSDNDKRKADIQEILRYVGNFVDRKSSFDDLISQYKQFIDDMELRAKGIRDAKEGLARRRADENRRLAEKERKAADMATKLEAAIADAKRTEAWSALSSTEKGQITRQVNALVAAFKDKKTDDDRFTKADELLGRLQEMIDAELSDDEKAERKRLADEADAERRRLEDEAAAARQREADEEARKARKRAEDDEAARKRAEDDEKPKEEEPEEAPAPWPKDYEFSYGERFGEVARDEDLPEEMRSDRRGGEEYRYRRMTAGEQVERRGDIRSLPERFMGALTALTGQITGVVIGREQKQIDVDVTLRSITNRDQFEIALKDVYRQTDDQAKALANVVDRFATGWSLEMMRLSGINTQDVYRAVRNSTDPRGFGVEEMKWKVVFREQSVLRNDEETLKTLKKLQAYYYTKRLGNISALNATQVQQIQSVGFTKGWYGNNGQIVNIAFALAGKENYVAQVHEVTHLLMKSMYAPMYHQLAAAVMPAYGVSREEFNFGDKEAGTFKRIDSWVEERMVTSFLRALVTNAPVNGVSPNILSESMREGGATFDMSINKTLNDLGYQLREVARTMQGRTDLAGMQQNILGEQGFIVPLPETPDGNVSGYYPTGTSFRVEGDKAGQVLELVLSEPWDALAEPDKQLQGYLIDENNKVVSTKGKRITRRKIQGIGQIRATFGLPHKVTGALKTPTTQGVTPLSATAQSVFSQFFGHWAEHTQNLLRTVDIDPIGTEVFVPQSPAEIRRYLVGYKWFKTPTDYRNAMNVTESEFNDSRINARIRQSYLGWLDAGGFDEYLSEDQIYQLEVGLSEAIVTPPKTSGEVEEAAPKWATVEDFMSTPMPDQQPKRAPKAKSEYREMSKRLIANYLTDLLAKGKDITEEAKDGNYNILVDKIMGLPFIRAAVTRAYTKAGLDISQKPFYKYFSAPDLDGKQLSQSARTAVRREYRLFDFKPDEDSADDPGHVQLIKNLITEQARDEYNASRLIQVRIQNLALREFRYALSGKKPASNFSDARKQAVDSSGNVVQILFPATNDDYTQKEWRDKRRVAAYQAIYNDLDLGQTLDLEDKTEPVLDSEGNQIPVLDKFGLPVMVEDLDRRLQPRLDADGNIKYKPVYQYRVVKAGLLASGKNIKDKQTVLEQFRESAPAWMSDDDVYEQYLRRVAIRDSEQFKAEQRSNIDSIVSRGMDAKVSLDQAKTAALYAELKQALGYETNRLRLAKYKANNRGVFMLPFPLFKESEAQKSGANLDELTRLQNEVRTFEYTMPIMVRGSVQDVTFTYTYSVGTPFKPGYSESAFLANHVDQLSDLVDRKFITKAESGIEYTSDVFEKAEAMSEAGKDIERSKLSAAELAAKTMFNLGYVQIENRGIPRFEEGSRDTKSSVYLGLTGSLNSVLQFVRPVGKNYQVLVQEDGVNTWEIVSPDDLADMLMTAAYRGIDRSIVVIRDTQRVSRSVDVQRTLQARVRHFVTGLVSGIDSSKLAQAEVTYLAAINAVTAKRQGIKSDRNKKLATLTVEQLRAGGDSRHWSGDAAKGQKVITELKKFIDELVGQYANEDAGESFQSFIALLNGELIKPEYRFIPAIADYQFRVEMAQRGESLLQEVSEAVRVVPTGDAKKPFSVLFADVTAPSANAIKQAESKIAGLIVKERVSDVALEEMLAAGKEPAVKSFTDDLIDAIDRGATEDFIGLMDRDASNLRKFREEASSKSFQNDLLDRIIAARWPDYVVLWGRKTEPTSGKLNRDLYPDLFVKLNVPYSEFKARLENTRTYRLRNVAEQATTSRLDLELYEESERIVRESAQSVFRAVIGDIESIIDAVDENDIAALLNIAQKSEILNTAPVYGKMSEESLIAAWRQLDSQIKSDPVLNRFVRRYVSNYDSIETSAERIAKFMNAMSGMSVALRTVANVNNSNVIVDSPAVVELLPSLTLRETAVLRVMQAAELLGSFDASQSRIAELLGVAPATVKQTMKTLIEKINTAEMRSIVTDVSYTTRPTASQKLANSFVSLASIDKITELMPDELTLTQRMSKVIQTLINAKAIMDNNLDVLDILQKVNANIKLSEDEQKRWNKATDVRLLNAIRLRALDSMHYLGQGEDIHGALSGVARIVNEASVLKKQDDIVEYDSKGRLVTIEETSDALPSASEMENAIKLSLREARGSKFHVSELIGTRGANTYDQLIERINFNLSGEKRRTYLTNAELRQVVLTNSANVSPERIKIVLKELMDLRDKAILDPLKDKLKGLDINEVTVGQLNDQMESMDLGIEDRVVAMSTLMNAATRQNEPQLVAWMIAEKRFPSFDEYLEIKGKPDSEEGLKTAENKYKEFENLQRSLGFNAIVDGVVGTKISMQEREKARSADVVSFNFDIRPQDLPLTEAMALSSIAYQQSVIDEFVSEENTIQQLTAETLSEALDRLRGVYERKSPLNVLPIPGAPRAVMPGSARGAEKLGPDLTRQISRIEDTAEQINVRMGRLAARVLRNGIDAIRDAFLIAEQTQTSIGELNPFFLRIGQRNLEAGWSRISALDALSLSDRKLVESLLNNFAKELTRGILDARLSWLAATKPNKTLDSFSYEVYDANANVFKAVDLEGQTKYFIDFSNARVTDAQGGREKVISASKDVTVYVPSVDANGNNIEIAVNITPAQKALYDLLSVGMTKDQLRKTDVTGQPISTRLIDIVQSNEALRSVPPVYWHAKTRITDRRPDAQDMEPMFLSTPMKSPVDVYNSVGTIDEATRRKYVFPVLTKWLAPDETGLQRVVRDNNNEPFFDGEGYTVWRADGKRSHIYAMLIDHGLTPSKALEIYALTENPVFKEWAEGDRIESALLASPGSFFSQGRVRNAAVKKIVYQGLAAQNLVTAIDRFMASPSDKNFDDFAFAYDEVDAFGAGVSDEDMVKLMMEIKNSPDRKLRMGIIRDKAEAMVATASTPEASSIFMSYKAYKDSEQEVRTGKPFHTLAFAHTTNSFLDYSAPGVGIFDLGSGLHTNSNRKNRPSWIKFKNPLVHNLHDANVTQEVLKDLIQKALSKGYDGIVLSNVVDTVNNPVRRNLAITLNDANIMPVSRMTRPTNAKRVAKATDIEPMFLSTPMYAPVTSNVVPPLLQGAGKIRELTTGEKAKNFGWYILDNMMSFARNPLSSDFAFSFIQAGKAFGGLAPWSWRPQDFVAWWRAAFGSLQGMAPNLQITIAGKKIGYDKLGRRQWIKVYQNLRQDDTWEIMKALNVPMHFMNFERRLESERVRMYTQAQGTVKFEDIKIDMLAYDERGNLDDAFERNTLTSMMPMSGMFERQMSLQHDLLMFYQIKWQLENNPEFKDLMTKADPVKEFSKSKSAKAMVNFIANSMGDFQYTTNDKVDIVASRLGKVFLMAPRWYMANIAIAYPAALVADNLYKHSPKYRKFVGAGNRSIGLYAHENKELKNYQLKVWLGTMMSWVIASIAAMIYGRLSRNPSVDWITTKGLGQFRIGNWEISESTGTLDFANTAYNVMREIGRGGIGTKPRVGETSEEAENAGFLRVFQRLSYKKSPFISLYYDKLFRGRDALNNIVYRPNEEFLYLWEDVFRNTINPALKASGMKELAVEDVLFTSKIATQQVPTAWQQVWETYSNASREELGRKDIASRTAGLAWLWSALGTRVQYRPFVPAEMQQLYSKQWVFKRFIEQQGRSGYDIMKEEGFNDWLDMLKHGKM